MSNKLNISFEITDKIVESITNTVPTKIIYIFNKHAYSDKTDNSEVNIYVVTEKK